MDEIISSLTFVNFGWQIITPLILMACDIVSGYIQAIINHTIDSSIMRKGLCHKILLILIIFVGVIIQYAFNFPAISVAICLLITIMEISSILENIKKAGIDLQILKYFNKEEKK